MKTVIFIVLILVQILIAFAVYRIVTKAMSKKRSEAESRLADLSQTAEGRTILEKESQEREVKNKKTQKVMAIFRIIAYLFILSAIIAKILIK